MPVSVYSKPHANSAQWVAHLRSKGLLVSRPSIAARKIELIGYEQLRAYFRSRRHVLVAGKPFWANTSFNSILNIYEFDTKLRAICLDACLRFERLFRNSLSEEMSHRFGSHPYDEISAFKSPSSRRDAIITLYGIYKKSDDPRAAHYLATYEKPILPPIWVMKELMTFGAVCWFLQTVSGPIRTQVGRQFGVNKDEIFVSWLECLLQLRNICSHHDRLFNHPLPKQPKQHFPAGIPIASANRVKAILECLDYMLTFRGSPSNHLAQVSSLLKKYPDVHPNELGF